MPQADHASLITKNRLGILGGGQLGRMMIENGAGLAKKFIVWDKNKDSPAMALSSHNIIAAFDDKMALQEFLSAIDSVVIEWENIPTQLVEKIAKHKPIIAPASILGIAQSRQAEKKFFLTSPIHPAPFAILSASDDRAMMIKKITTANLTLPAILKTDRLGYDGKGQYIIKTIDDILAAIENQTGDFVLEQKINFISEGSVLVARDRYGKVISYPMVENIHKNGILHSTSYPAKKISPALQKTAIHATKQMANKLNLIGLLCVEYFISHDEKLIANEMAPRPHNSFHWTIEAVTISQFLQITRIALGLSAIEPEVKANGATMYNILGDDINHHKKWHNKKNYFLHLYGKTIATPNRKMGHYTILS
ncbi:MAG: 5-(carboxyamino)imidazole ribonucleotide synthase [Alphaproteobacteria bacterium]